MTPVKLIFVSGVGGARADFIAGWLGLHPKFVNSYWNIDTNTGLSVGEQGNARSLAAGRIPEDIINEFGFTLSSESTLIWALAMHPVFSISDILVENVNENKISFIQIDTDEADQTKINWEFLVKTYLTERRSINSFRTNEQWVIDKQIQKTNITDSDRIELLMSLAQRMNFKNTTTSLTLSEKLNPINVKYTELFKLGGSKYLCDTIKLEMPDSAHEYWDNVIKFADSPESLMVWGRIWTKQDMVR